MQPPGNQPDQLVPGSSTYDARLTQLIVIQNNVKLSVVAVLPASPPLATLFVVIAAM